MRFKIRQREWKNALQNKIVFVTDDAHLVPHYGKWAAPQLLWILQEMSDFLSDNGSR